MFNIWHFSYFGQLNYTRLCVESIRLLFIHLLKSLSCQLLSIRYLHVVRTFPKVLTIFLLNNTVFGARFTHSVLVSTRIFINLCTFPLCMFFPFVCGAPNLLNACVTLTIFTWRFLEFWDWTFTTVQFNIRYLLTSYELLFLLSLGLTNKCFFFI